MAASLVMLSSSSRVDAFLMSPQLLSSAAAAAVFGRREPATTETTPSRMVPSRQSSRRVRQMVVGMVSAAAVDGAASTSKEADGDAGLSLGERLRADFPILDQVCTWRMHCISSVAGALLL